MRLSWDDYFLKVAKLVSERATCPRASCGAVIVKDNRIVATGYNGSPPGEPHCIDIGCIVVDDHCQRALHAEINAIAQVAVLGGSSTDGATIYIYGSNGRSKPCRECLKVIKAAHISRIVCYE